MFFRVKVASQLVPSGLTAFARSSSLDDVYAVRTFIQYRIQGLRATLHRFQVLADTLTIASIAENRYDNEFAKLLELANSLPCIDQVRVRRAAALSHYAPAFACNILTGEIRRVLYAQLWRLNDHLWLAAAAIACGVQSVDHPRRRTSIKNYLRWFVRRCCHPADAFSRAAVWITGPMEGAPQATS